MIKLQDVSFSYRKQKVISHTSFTFTKGKFYGIVGPNGSGKTTLLDLIGKHILPDSGTITYAGKDISSLKQKHYALELALVPQNFSINFPFTVRQIVMMGRYPHIPRFSSPSEEDCEIVESIMKQTAIQEFAERLITKLSTGERQRVIFARALAQNTPLLMLDEATSSLDIRYSLSLLSLTKNLVKNQGKTVISVFHDLNLAASFCDYLVFIKAGKIITHGTVAQTLDSKTIHAVFAVNAKVYHEEFSNTPHVVFKDGALK